MWFSNPMHLLILDRSPGCIGGDVGSNGTFDRCTALTNVCGGVDDTRRQRAVAAGAIEAAAAAKQSDPGNQSNVLRMLCSTSAPGMGWCGLVWASLQRARACGVPISEFPSAESWTALELLYAVRDSNIRHSPPPPCWTPPLNTVTERW